MFRVSIRHFSSLQRHASSLLGKASRRVGMITAGWTLRGGRDKKKYKNTPKNINSNKTLKMLT